MEQESAKRGRFRILIVDDIPMNVDILDNILTHEGYTTMCAVSVQEAINLMKEQKPTLVLSDLSMPEVDGLEFCRMLKGNPRTRDIPFVFISVMNTSEEKEQAFLAGAVDFIPKPFDAVEVIMRVNNHLKTYQLQQEMAEHNRMMHKFIDHQKEQIEQEQKNVLLALATLMQKRNAFRGGHLENVGYNCGLLAQGLQFLPKYENVISDEFIETIKVAARIHSIGKFVVPDKDGGNRLEYLEKCAEEGAGVLEEIGAGQERGRFLSMAIRIAGYYGARWDGSGYPAAAGRDIPLEARIVALANDFDNLGVDGDGREAFSVEESVRIIGEKSGTFYDPDIVGIFDRIWRKLRRG